MTDIIFDNTLASARDIGTLNSQRSFTDSIGGLDTNDYYRFNVGSPSNFSLRLTGLSADADVLLLNNAGAVISFSNAGGNSSESINSQLGAGNYYVLVYPYSGSTNYNLLLNAVVADDYANTTATTGVVNIGSSTTGRIDFGGDSDWFRVNLVQGTTYQFAENRTTLADPVLTLRNSVGTVLTSNDDGGGNLNSLITYTATSTGVHFLDARGFSSTDTGTYTVTAAVVPTPTPTPTPTQADWTFMVYLDADNNLESSGIDDFLEMAAVGSTATVNIVVQFDRIAGEDNRYGDWTDTRRGLVRSGDTPTQNWGTTIGEANMGAQNTLSDFVTWSMSNYRANNYATILWNHGGGYTGIAWDDTNNGDRLELREVSGALSSLSRSIDVLGTDACLMGMAEFAHQIRNNASVLVGSEEIIPGEGWNYTTVLSDLTGNSSMTANQLGTVMVNRYGQFYGSQGNNGTEETLSAINLVNLRTSNPNNLSTAISQFATTFMNSSTSNDRSSLSTHRNSAASFDQRPNNRDLGTILSRVASDTTMTGSIRTAAQTALTAYNNLIIQNYSSINGRATGMAIYFQARGGAVDSYYNSSNLSFANDTTWDEFLNWWRTA